MLIKINKCPAFVSSSDHPTRTPRSIAIIPTTGIEAQLPRLEPNIYPADLREQRNPALAKELTSTTPLPDSTFGAAASIELHKFFAARRAVDLIAI
ncbi:hypothetical protein Q31a_61330 [Aureliella helgolandensis]|uniref:Uncharacterized protein n=1 Tax=Aureliella helgolandensis TaxID=2527968 RepID=A0A518GGM9_9BACT|nr:hypothetical protein Q31a_61330 [Aureliella helgolandensis]